MTQPSGLFLGRVLDLETGALGAHLRLDPRDLTTHGVVIGMTGSGKTGLCIDLLEEAALAGIPRRRAVSVVGALAAIAVLAAVRAAPAQVLDLSGYEIADLTHPFGPGTLYWPTSPFGFEVDTLAWGPTDAGFFYASLAIRAPEHGGTHLDAPVHFDESGRTADRIPLEQLVGAAVVLDVSAQAASDRDYRLTIEDVLAFESRYGRIEKGTIALLRTGWSRRYGDRGEYFGSEKEGDASDLHFPSYGEEAARLLVEERKVALLGVDTASIDYGPSKDFVVHRLAAAAGVPGLENLTSLDRLPPAGALVVALPMKIEGGSGGPARVIALVPRTGGT